MNKVYFKDYPDTSTAIPKVMWWYCIEIKYKGCLNAEYANYLFNNDLKEFFEKYPDELYNASHLDWHGNNDITEEESKFYFKELGDKIKEGNYE